MILTIDTTDTKRTSSAILDSDLQMKAELVEEQEFGSQVLLPMIQKLLKKTKLTLDDLTEIKVNPGPGSFTGTRVGVSIANILGFALKIPVNGKRGKIVLPIYEKSKFDL